MHHSKKKVQVQDAKGVAGISACALTNTYVAHPVTINTF
jgi:hypothetical protein